MVPEEVESLADLLQSVGWPIYQGLLENRIRIAYKEIGEKSDPIDIYRAQGKITAYRDAALLISRLIMDHSGDSTEMELNRGTKGSGTVGPV